MICIKILREFRIDIDNMYVTLPNISNNCLIMVACSIWLDVNPE